MAKRDLRQIEFGDFQTPDALAAQVVALLRNRGIRPASVVEPTCGLGSFILAAMRGFESPREILGLEVNHDYFARADARLSKEPRRPILDLRRADFFSFDWSSVIRSLPQPVLLLGNPPWVTSSGLGAINGTNMPEKSNFQAHRGLDSITGKGNFDIAEWMLIKLLEAASGTLATLAMLVKTSVARRLMTHAWRTKIPITSVSIYIIDAAKHFDVAASACLILCSMGESPVSMECDVFELDKPTVRLSTIAYRDEMLIADANAYDRVRHLMTDQCDPEMRWRSGVKHDCSRVMELRKIGPDCFANGMGEPVSLESEYLYPMMKGSDVAGARCADGQRWMIVPQRSTGDDTSEIAKRAPRTWDYLCKHGHVLDKRGSSIYRKRPRFAVFGVGPYTFAPWKVAICGLYKRSHFVVVPPYEDRPVVFDDTVCHLSLNSEGEAQLVGRLLNSALVTDFLKAVTFWDAKRPITIDLLSKLDLRLLVKESIARDGHERFLEAVKANVSMIGQC